MKFNVIILLVASSISFQIVAMEPESPKKGWRSWVFEKAVNTVALPGVVAYGMCDSLCAFATKAPENAVRIHIWDMNKRRFQTTNGEAMWNGTINAFVVSEKYMQKLQADFPGKVFYCNKHNLVSKVAEYMSYWQYRLVTEVQETLAIESNTVFEPLLQDQPENSVVDDKDGKYEMVDIDRPQQDGIFIHANKDLPLGFWFKTFDNTIYEIKVVKSEHDRVIRRIFRLWQA